MLHLLQIIHKFHLLLPCRDDNPNPPNPQTARLFGRLAIQCLLTGYEPNAIVEISRTDVTLMLLPSRRASFCSAYNSGEDATSGLVSSEVDERQSTGRLASPLFMQKREASVILARISHPTGEMSRSSHIPSTEKLFCDTLTQTEVEQGHKKRTRDTSHK